MKAWAQVTRNYSSSALNWNMSWIIDSCGLIMDVFIFANRLGQSFKMIYWRSSSMVLKEINKAKFNYLKYRAIVIYFIIYHHSDKEILSSRWMIMIIVLFPLWELTMTIFMIYCLQKLRAFKMWQTLWNTFFFWIRQKVTQLAR